MQVSENRCEAERWLYDGQSSAYNVLHLVGNLSLFKVPGI